MLIVDHTCIANTASRRSSTTHCWRRRAGAARSARPTNRTATSASSTFRSITSRAQPTCEGCCAMPATSESATHTTSPQHSAPPPTTSKIRRSPSTPAESAARPLTARSSGRSDYGCGSRTPHWTRHSTPPAPSADRDLPRTWITTTKPTESGAPRATAATRRSGTSRTTPRCCGSLRRTSKSAAHKTAEAVGGNTADGLEATSHSIHKWPKPLRI